MNDLREDHHNELMSLIKKCREFKIEDKAMYPPYTLGCLQRLKIKLMMCEKRYESLIDTGLTKEQAMAAFAAGYGNVPTKFREVGTTDIA